MNEREQEGKVKVCMPDGREKGRGNNSIRQSGMAGGRPVRPRPRPTFTAQRRSAARRAVQSFLLRRAAEALQLRKKAPSGKAPRSLARSTLLLTTSVSAAIPPAPFSCSSGATARRQNLRSESRFDFMEAFYCCAEQRASERTRGRRGSAKQTAAKTE